MAHTQTETQTRKRPPMSAEQRVKLSVAQRAYVTHDPRWPEHRRKLAAAQEAKRMTLFDNEVAAIVALRGTMAIARLADLVVQPTGASADDLRPAVREFHALVQAGVPKAKLAFALNRIGTEAEEAEARAYIAEAGYDVLDGCLLERPAYRKAMNVGRAITETSYAGLNAKADALIQALIDCATGWLISRNSNDATHWARHPLQPRQAPTWMPPRSRRPRCCPGSR